MTKNGTKTLKFIFKLKCFFFWKLILLNCRTNNFRLNSPLKPKEIYSQMLWWYWFQFYENHTHTKMYNLFLFTNNATQLYLDSDCDFPLFNACILYLIRKLQNLIKSIQIRYLMTSWIIIKMHKAEESVFFLLERYVYEYGWQNLNHTFAKV